MGKTSLLARGVQHARQEQMRVVVTDFQKLSASQMESADDFFLAVAGSIADQLDLDGDPAASWRARRGASTNFERYLRAEALDKINGHLLWAMDEVDRLFGCSFGSEVFGLFRSWHNERSLDPSGPWRGMTLAIAYATEPHLFITDVNQSPFNVGTRLELRDFTFQETSEMNRRIGSPLRSEAEVSRYSRLVGGSPYLVHRGLQEMVSSEMDLPAFALQADRDDGVFGDHLRRMLSVLAKDDELCEVVRGLLRGGPCPTPHSYYRLRAAGIIGGDSARNAKFRCEVYANYLERHLL